MRNTVRDAVWKLSHDTAGMSAHFEADTPPSMCVMRLPAPMLAMPHMPATGKSGLESHAPRGWRRAGDTQSPRSLFRRSYAPRYQARSAGLPNQPAPVQRRKVVGNWRSVCALFTPIAPRTDKPILFYGTSITQGGCASRPGSAFVSILGRRLDRPILNFGFSGNGLYELEVGRLLADLDPAIFAIDCVGNSTTEQIAERTEPLVKLLRGRHPLTPILLLDRPIFPNANLVSHGKMDPLPEFGLILKRISGSLLPA